MAIATRTGKQLIRDLGLSEFKYYWIQKVLNVSINMFIVTIDSRYPNTYLSVNKVKNLFSMLMIKGRTVADGIKMGKLTMTPPVPLEQFSGFFPTGSVILRHDLAGEYYGNKNTFKKMNEDFTKKRDDILIFDI